jgi:hypothetical protein
MGQTRRSREEVCMSNDGTLAAEFTSDLPGTASVLEGASPAIETPPLAGTWKVGSLNPALVKVLTFLGFALPAGAYLAVLAYYQVNAIVGDQWDDVHTIALNYGHFPDWSSLWSLHTDNRVFFPNLIVVGLAHTVSLNIEVEEYLSALMLFAAVALFIWAHKRRSPTTPLLYYCPIAFLMLSFVQWQNTLWGFQMAWYLIVLAFALTVNLLDRAQLGRLVFIGAVLAAVVGSYSSLQGLLIWPVGLVLLYHRRRPTWTFVSWVVAGVATTAWYLHDYHAPSSTPHFALEHPLLFVKFFLFALGDIVGVQMKFSGPANAGVMVFGAVILALAVFVVLKWGIRRDEPSGAPIGVALIAFGLLFDVLITEGRLVFGIFGASQSRYTTFDLLVLGGIYMTTLGVAPSRVEVTSATRRPHPARARIRAVVDRVDRRSVAAVALAAIVIQLAFGIHYGLEGARSEHQDYVTYAALTRNIDHESDGTVRYLYFVETPEWIREQVAFLREHHLSLFG